MFTVLKLLSPLFNRPRAVAEAAVLDAAPEVQDPSDDESPAGCGWYDSSHDLNHGLTVREDVSAAELPLANWLEMHLGAWCAAPRPA